MYLINSYFKIKFLIILCTNQTEFFIGTGFEKQYKLAMYFRISNTYQAYIWRWVSLCPSSFHQLSSCNF